MKEKSSSSASSVCDYDFGFGEILEYHEDADSHDSIVFSDPFTASGPFSFEHSLSASSFDGKGKLPAHKVEALDQYHPENSKNEVIEHVARSMSNVGQIQASQLRHSSEQWSNYNDLCEAVCKQLRRDGYAAATVECVVTGSDRHIVYRLS